jgi:serine acetyltransferase
MELVEQLTARGVTRDSEITFVAGVGTGASLVAYARVLKIAFPLVKVVCAEPLGCSMLNNQFMDHPFQGLNVGVVPALLDPSLIDECETATIDEADNARTDLIREAGLFLGLSSCLVYAVAKKRRDKGDRLVVMIGYDGGETYFADAQSETLRVKQVLKAIEWARAALPSSETMGLSITDYEAIFTEAQSFIEEDLTAYLRRDPAARDAAVVEEAYLCFKAVAVYRIASGLYRYQDDDFTDLPSGRPPPTKAVARRLSEMIRGETSVEIHPGARIGRRFVIDHGTDTVIGEDAIIGDDCYILNGVTVGSGGIADNHRDGRRHPTLGDRVQVGGHSSILGPVTVGDDVFIGPHQQVVHDVPSNTRITTFQELLMERVTDTPGPRPEIHALLATITGSLRVIGRNLDIATVTMVTRSGEEHPQLRILDQSGTACEIVAKLAIDPEADLESVSLRVSASGIALTLQNSLALKRAFEAIRGGHIVL